ncbi:hypothetical protein EJB00_03010 [Wolbachia endosymbiont of Drosophila mauritiana]|nr:MULTISPECIES: hypothetical protein [unclassified Wolbachia]QCB62587.1 hypothetical protein EJA99_03015 [Wolbachia endosymbiont of Drosophila mauritiana]QCB63634.1 hypothetical protein EJB00_03010 [Wolbachia endosymbiont of Drosophila mauritiana]TGB07788.1 hypothetical protein E5C28_00465 [Wolbachia endosymbiont of Drosophila mauritiana]
MVVTTYFSDAESKKQYSDYDRNKSELLEKDVTIINDMNISENSNSIKELEPYLTEGSQLHFHMPRVPRATSGYSTQQLIKDFLKIPSRLDIKDTQNLELSLTVPHPKMYQAKIFKGLYGLYKKSPKDNFYKVSEGIEDLETVLSDSESDNEEDLSSKFDYKHKQSTSDDTADVAKNKKMFIFWWRKASRLNWS